VAALPLAAAARENVQSTFEMQGVTVFALSQFQDLLAMHTYLKQNLGLPEGVAVQCVRMVNSMRDVGHSFEDILSGQEF
jgi:hypothetical protein